MKNVLLLTLHQKYDGIANGSLEADALTQIAESQSRAKSI